MTDDEDELLVGVAARRRLSVSLIAMLPLFALYEWARASLAEGGQAWRNTSEVFFSKPLELIGAGVELRWAILAAVGAAAIIRVWQLGVAWGEGVLWSVLEGLMCGILLGPVMMLLTGWLDFLPAGQLRENVAPPLDLVCLELSGAVWEELLFRLVVLLAIYQLGRWLFRFLDREDAEHSVWPAEVLAITLSSLAFAASHLEVVVGWLGYGGESYDLSLFAWRAFAGLWLATIARARGLGVAAWTHAVFNLGVILGAGPGVFLGGTG